MVIPDSICHLKSRQRLLANFVRWKPFGNSSEGQKKNSTLLKYRLNLHGMIKFRYGERLIEQRVDPSHFISDLFVRGVKIVDFFFLRKR